MNKFNHNVLNITVVYFGIISLGLSQPLFNVVELFQREFQISLTGLILIVICFQYVVTGLLFLFRLILGKWGEKFDYVVYLGALISLLRQLQINYLETEFLSPSQKTGVAIVLILGAIVAILLFKRVIDQFSYFLGMVSPILGIYFVITMMPHVAIGDTRTVDQINSAPTPSNPPIIFIVLDELSLPLLLNNEGDIDKSKYPNFYALAHESVWFRQAISNYPSSSLSFPSFLTGRLNLNKNDMKFPQDVETLPPTSLPRFLIKKGYNVSILTDFFGCKGKDFECPRYLSDQNFNFIWRIFSKFVQEFGPDYLVDRYLPFLHGGLLNFQYESVLHVAKTAKSDTFYLVHLLTTHAPYVFAETGDYLYSPDLKMGTGANYSNTLLNYKKQVTYQDKQLGKLIESFKKSGLYEKAVIAIIADHGNCWTAKCPGRVYPSQIRTIEPSLPKIPVFIRAPGLKPRVDDGDFQLIDIMPTIIDAAGFSAGELTGIDGRSALLGIETTRPRNFILQSSGESVDVGLPVRRIIVKSE